MATATIADGTLTLELRPWDRILSVHGTLRIPLEHITAASSGPPPPVPWLTKLMGANIPGVMAKGTFFSHEGLLFYDYGVGNDCLLLDLNHEHYSRVVVEIDAPQSPAAIAAQIAQAKG